MIPDPPDPDEPQDQQPEAPRMSKQMSVVECQSGRADDPDTGQPCCILTLGFLGEPQPPMMLPLSEVRVLAAKLIEVLDYFDDGVAQQISSLYLQDGRWPGDDPPQGPRVPKAGKTTDAKPSILPQTPATPLSAAEAWRMTQMVRHAADHATFLRFIGAVVPKRINRHPTSPASKRQDQRKRGPGKRRRR